MNTTQHRRIVPVIASTALALALGAIPAQARPEEGPPTAPSSYPYFHALQRVGSQFVAGDELTGNGVPAPAWVDER